MYAELARLNLESRANAMSDVIARYRKEVVPGKAARTQRDNERELALLNRAFGHMTPGKITAQHIYQYMDARRAPVRANREKALLSHVFKYAIRWGVVTDNPCRLVVRNTERPRTRYVDDAEFLAVYDRATTAVQAAMRLAVLTGMRQGDLLALTLHNCRDDGIHMEQKKTGKRLIFDWSPELHAAIDLARSMPRRAESPYLIVTRDGVRYTSSGFQTAWQRLMDACVHDGVIRERFTFHDLRAKAGSEHSDAMRFLGHQSETTTRRIYQRKPDRVKPLK